MWPMGWRRLGVAAGPGLKTSAVQEPRTTLQASGPGSEPNLEKVEVLRGIRHVDFLDQLVYQLAQLRLAVFGDEGLCSHDLSDEDLHVSLRRQVEQVDGFLTHLRRETTRRGAVSRNANRDWPPPCAVRHQTPRNAPHLTLPYLAILLVLQNDPRRVIAE